MKTFNIVSIVAFILAITAAYGSDSRADTQSPIKVHVTQYSHIDESKGLQPAPKSFDAYLRLRNPTISGQSTVIYTLGIQFCGQWIKEGLNNYYFLGSMCSIAKNGMKAMLKVQAEKKGCEFKEVHAQVWKTIGPWAYSFSMDTEHSHHH
jgi:hypothetical protein